MRKLILHSSNWFERSERIYCVFELNDESDPCHFQRLSVPDGRDRRLWTACLELKMTGSLESFNSNTHYKSERNEVSFWKYIYVLANARTSLILLPSIYRQKLAPACLHKSLLDSCMPQKIVVKIMRVTTIVSGIHYQVKQTPFSSQSWIAWIITSMAFVRGKLLRHASAMLRCGVLVLKGFAHKIWL